MREDIFATYGQESYAAKNAKEVLEIKGHKVYLCDVELYGGLCAFAFKNEHIIYDVVKVNHTSCKTDKELKARYIDVLNSTLYTEDELKVVKNYDDYTLKDYYIRNYYGNQVDHLSMFYALRTKTEYMMIGLSNPKKDEIYEKLRETYTVPNPVCFAFFKEEDKAFSDHLIELHIGLEKAKDTSEESEEYMEEAFLYEMNNHEYAINYYQGDWEVCGCFGNCKWGESKNYIDYLTEMGKANLIPVYERARKRHYKNAENW